jgi:hypothetical protein
MDVSRRRAGRLIAALYVGGGLLLLNDFLTAPPAAEAHLPLAWHVFPLALLASLAAAIAEVSAPLDPVWHVPVPVVVASYLLALATCAAVMMRLVAGAEARRREIDGQTGGDRDRAD